MLFNSIDFAIFLPIVFLLYWAFYKRLSYQNGILLIASYFFYACWDYRFLGLLAFSTIVDYVAGIKVFEARDSRTKKRWLWLSIGLSLTLLCFFKYFNFFADSMAEALSLLGIKVNYGLLQIGLPIGISFYTFHGLSYILDVYKGKIRPERKFIDYAVFVSFFPLLVAGPIERATHLLPQIGKKRVFDYGKAVDGLRQILWGLFKKLVIADNCADYVNLVFSNPGEYSGSTHLLGMIFFAFQVYGDFSGYSDIAIGTAKLFGIDLLRNFAFPYFSRSIAEFWRRWHISLSSWFRDYIYIPLGGSRGNNLKKIRNVMIVFLVSGLWHGANWTFILYGLLNALYFLPSVLFRRQSNPHDIVAKGKLLPSGAEFFSIAITFLLTIVAFVLFRSPTLSQAGEYYKTMFSASFFTFPEIRPVYLFLTLILFLIIEWLGRENQYAIQFTGFKWNRIIRWSFYLLLTVLIFVNFGREIQFVYFQF